MSIICEVVDQALRTGYLSIEAEERLRQLLSNKYDQQDLSAFMRLQRAAMSGLVQQESRSLMTALKSQNTSRSA